MLVSDERRTVCAGRLNRGDTVCDVKVTVTASEAEDKVLEMLENVIYNE